MHLMRNIKNETVKYEQSKTVEWFPGTKKKKTFKFFFIKLLNRSLLT